MPVLASACMAMSAALEEGRDPTATDLLAVSAAGEIVMFETGQFWFESLQILDYVLGVQRHPIAEEAWLSINSRNDRRQIEAAVVKRQKRRPNVILRSSRARANKQHDCTPSFSDKLHLLSPDEQADDEELRTQQDQ